VLYPEGQLHSPITADIAAALARIAAQVPAAEDVLGKVGDSMTATTSFLACFDGPGVDLGDHAALAATLAYFHAGNAAGATPYSRVSLAATGGWTTADVLAGAPSPLDREITAIAPRYGVTQLGTNDARFGRTLDAFGADLWAILDRELASGAIPILSTLPALHGDPSNARIPLFNRVIRAIAQGHSLPLVDLHLALSGLPNEGIGADGIHPTVAPQGACALTTGGLGYGYNQRNLITLEALDRARRARGGEPLDAGAPRRAGSGTHADPFRGQLPLIDMADTRRGESMFAGYPSCGLTASGHEIVYRLDLPAATAIDAFVVDRDAVDVDVAILGGALATSACVAAGDHSASATVGPGPVFVVVDSQLATTEGEFVIVVQVH
jgi:lysophospholipase L1-like esterase